MILAACHLKVCCLMPEKSATFPDHAPARFPVGWNHPTDKKSHKINF
ncbi:MAG TPA: hypothetical protein VG271_06430 [Beijerinckiaceae bacterium]|nr:hypothetical protein [Beijerinckiaceae bacterium]